MTELRAAAPAPAVEAAFLAAAEQRAQHVALLLRQQPGSWYRALVPLRESAADVTPLIAAARSGLRARILIKQHDGWARRLDLVRQLHEATDRGAGLLVCQECSRPFATALWPCLTLQVLDGMPPP